MRAGADRPLRLVSNRVDYLVPGGRMIDDFLGAEPTGTGQLWVASTVRSALPGAKESRSRLAKEDGGGLLAELLAKAPEEYLGEAHVRAFGADPGFLLKLLNSRQRLLVQTHPDDQKAQRYFGSPMGKTEGWVVLKTDPSQPAYIWAGFQPHVTRESFRQLIQQQDTEAILRCLHRFEVKPRDVIFIPAGMPHALGAASLVAEIQQPTDITLRAERRLEDGTLLPPESLDSGIGLEGLLDCFDFDWGQSAEAVRARCFVPSSWREVPGGQVRVLLGPAQTPCFTLTGIHCTGKLERSNASFRVLLVEKGSGFLEAGGTRLALRQGDELFLPAGVRRYRLEAQGSLTVLECAPPLPKEEDELEERL